MQDRTRILPNLISFFCDSYQLERCFFSNEVLPAARRFRDFSPGVSQTTAWAFYPRLNHYSILRLRQNCGGIAKSIGCGTSSKREVSSLSCLVPAVCASLHRSTHTLDPFLTSLVRFRLYGAIFRSFFAGRQGIESIFDFVNAFSLGFMICTHQDFGKQSHQDELDADHEEHCDKHR